MKLIDKDTLVAEIESLLDKGRYHEEYDCAYRDGNNSALYALKGKIDTLEVKEIDEKPNPRFPHYEDIVDKVFGAGNLELWEYEEAEQLVLLAKEELLKDLEVKEVDLDVMQRMEECPYRQVGCTMYEGKILECNGACSWVVDYPRLKELKAQKG